MKRLLLLLCVLLPAQAADWSQFGYQQHPGTHLPLAARFLDSTGQSLTLGQAAGKLPLIIAMVYYHCPSLCGVVRSDLFFSLSRTQLAAGRDYSLAVISIDPADKPSDAASAKSADLASFPQTGARNWHFLTGRPADIRAVAQAVGFRYQWDPTLHQFIHPAGIVFATADGTISSYLLGAGYTPGDVRVALTRAQNHMMAFATPIFLLCCFDFDPVTGRYTLAIFKLLQLAGFFTVLTVGGMLLLAFRRERRL